MLVEAGAMVALMVVEDWPVERVFVSIVWLELWLSPGERSSRRLLKDVGRPVMFWRLGVPTFAGKLWDRGMWPVST